LAFALWDEVVVAHANTKIPRFARNDNPKPE